MSKARRLKPKHQMMFETYMYRLDTVPPVEGYGRTVAQARAAAIEKAKNAGHKIVLRVNTLYVLE